jgi:hypothetical protein
MAEPQKGVEASGVSGLQGIPFGVAAGFAGGGGGAAWSGGGRAHQGPGEACYAFSPLVSPRTCPPVVIESAWLLACAHPELAALSARQGDACLCNNAKGLL